MKKIFLFVVFLFIVNHSYPQEKRLALVIGNGNYDFGGTLANPENDAKAISNKLRELNFNVIEHVNLDQRSMKLAIDDFGAKLKSYDVGLFFYAGHGVQVDGNNYLIPSDARLGDENDVEYNCVRAGRVLGKMESANSKTNIVILDACRDNPFERSWNRGLKGKGLAFMNAPSGSLIAYATSPGNTASDGTGENGLYTEALLEHIGITNLSIENIFKRVRIRVEEKSNGMQIPWESTSLKGSFYFVFDENAPFNIKEEIASQWVIITSEPEEGDLYIDDQYFGQTPFQQEMKEGVHTYRLVKDLYHPETGQFNLVATEGRKIIDLKLKPNFGFAKIITTPEEGAVISIDGNLQKETTPFTSGIFKSGTHTVTVSKNMYKPTTQSFDILDGQTTEVKINMIPQFGTLTIESYPESGASVTINGQPTGEVTPFTKEKLTSGQYTVTLRRQWYEIQSKQFKIGDGENKVIKINMKSIFGEIDITTEPLSDIYIDGDKKGYGTYSGRLTAGLHLLEARKDKYHSDQKKAEIEIGSKHKIILKPFAMQGILKIITNPYDALIVLNGKDYGTSPQTIRKLPIGIYSLELSKAGYDKVIKQLEIKDNEVTELNEVLSAREHVTAETKPKPEDKKVLSEIVKEDNDSKITTEKTEDTKELKEKTSYGSSIKVGKVMLLSSVVPGLGLTKLSEGKPYWLLGVVGGGCIAASVYYNKKAASSFNDYLNSENIGNVDDYYNDAVKQENLSKIFIISAAAIWIVDLGIAGFKAIRLNKSITNRRKNALSVGYHFDLNHDIPVLSLRFNF